MTQVQSHCDKVKPHCDLTRTIVIMLECFGSLNRWNRVGTVDDMVSDNEGHTRHMG